MLDIRFTVPALVLVPAFAVCGIVLVVCGRRRAWGSRLLGWRLLLAGYVAGLVGVTFFPFQVEIGRYAAQVSWLSGLQVVPLVTADLRSFVLNIVMTVPLGFLVRGLAPELSTARVVLSGFLISLGIELGQLVTGVLLGASRSADVNDLIANTTGALAGCLLFRTAGPVMLRHNLLPRSRAVPTPTGA